jgi:lipid II:glycine glycyltransferase (peptidoglycan interpeptide bridge formation enzyme)
MSIAIKEIANKQEWEEFLRQCGQKSFLASWAWGEFQVGQGFMIKRIGAVDKSGLRAVVMGVKIKARRGTYILIQHGPNFIETNPEEIQKILNELFFELAHWAASVGASFIRCAPLLERKEQNLAIFKKLGFRIAPMHANAYEATWKLDITPSEDDLLKGMRKTTRYLIRAAQKNSDIAIEKSADPEQIEIYGQLNEEVARRQKFVAFKRDYIEREFDTFAKDGQALWFIGRYKGQPAAAALIIFWSGIGFYHQAASKGEFAKYSIPYLLQWEAIKEAKRRGCLIYDFWGFNDPKVNPKHPWAGPTLFKMGFGGQAYEYVKTQDLPLSWKYWPTYIFESLRKFKRGL